MPIITLDSVYRKSDQLVAAEFPGEVVVLSLIDSKYYAGGDSAAAVWALIDGSRSVDDVIAMLSHEFDAPSEQIHADVAAFVSDLVELRLLERV